MLPGVALGTAALDADVGFARGCLAFEAARRLSVVVVGTAAADAGGNVLVIPLGPTWTRRRVVAVLDSEAVGLGVCGGASGVFLTLDAGFLLEAERLSCVP